MDEQRLSAPKIAPDGYKALRGVEAYLHQCGLEKSLIELVKMRASQINGCAYCLDMHSKDARRGGRDRAAALCAQRLARSVDLHAARTRGARLDGGVDSTSPRRTHPTTSTRRCARTSARRRSSISLF